MRELRVLDNNHLEEMKLFFKDVFTKEPWNDDWSDEEQLHMYITELTGNKNSLALGLFEENELVGLAMGMVWHWYTGTQYNIQELCIKTEAQGKGFGTYFLKQIEKYLLENNIRCIFLQTEHNVPAYQFYKKNGFTELVGHVSFVKEIE